MALMMGLCVYTYIAYTKHMHMHTYSLKLGLWASQMQESAGNAIKRAAEASEQAFEMPVTQVVLADTLGLSIVHVNRTLRRFRREGLSKLLANLLAS